MTTAAPQSEKLEFKTELKQLLHIITHSLYSHKEIFLRELISNASDAINKIKFDSLDREDLLEGNKDWKIKIVPDAEKGTLTITDTGIGLTRDQAVENLGTIARSGTAAFLENLRSREVRTQPELIGQFGVGFYSAFMVADRVTVISRAAGEPEGIRWESDGQGEFVVEPWQRAARGTDVILHLKEEEKKEFLDPWKLRQLVKRFSDFIEHPVVMDTEKEEGEGDDKKKVAVEETVNSRKAIWLRSKSDNSAEEYNTFYRQISNDFVDPVRVIQYAAEGAQEFKVLLFIPKHKPFDLQYAETKWGLKLYVQRVLIMDHCEALLPSYLRFVKGVVDSSDLPLNISRELLQQNAQLEKIKNNVVKSVLKSLEEMKADDYEAYVAFFKELGGILKEGPRLDWANRERIADLLLFESLKTPAGQFTTLAKYVEGLPADQKEIFYLIGESREQLENSPYLERFRARGQDVLLLTDPVDEFMIPTLGDYKGKSFKGVDRSELDATKPEGAEAFAKLFEALKAKLPEVTEVRLSTRLEESAACLVTPERGMSAHLERLMARMGRGEEFGGGQRILELNGKHAAVQGLLKVFEKDAADPRLESHARLLYDQAVIAEGSKVKDPAAFARRINELLLKDIGG